MYGCKYCKMDMIRQEEYCTLTGEPTKNTVMCDLDFEFCSEYQNAQKSGAKRAPKLIQTSVFGTSGEKPFGV